MKKHMGPCNCGSVRFMNLFMKHNDLAAMSIPHLDIEVQDYLPYVGRFGGDDTNFTVCMDCGTIQGWIQLSDADILNNDAFQQHLKAKAEEEAAELEREAEHKRLVARDKSPNVITLSYLVKSPTGKNENCPMCGKMWAAHNLSSSTPQCPE